MSHRDVMPADTNKAIRRVRRFLVMAGGANERRCRSLPPKVTARANEKRCVRKATTSAESERALSGC